MEFKKDPLSVDCVKRVFMVTWPESESRRWQHKQPLVVTQIHYKRWPGNVSLLCPVAVS